MVILGLLLIVAGALAIVAGLFGIDGTAELMGSDLHGTTIFLIGVAAGVAVLWGYTVVKFGLRRSLQHRRESKQLSELSEKLEKVEAERREERGGADEGTHRL